MKAWCTFSCCFVCLWAAGRDADGPTWMGLSLSAAECVTDTPCFCFRRQILHLCWHQKSPLHERSGAENLLCWRWPYCSWMFSAGGEMGELRCTPAFLAEWCKDKQLALEAASKSFLSVSKLCSVMCPLRAQSRRVQKPLGSTVEVSSMSAEHCLHQAMSALTQGCKAKLLFFPAQTSQKSAVRQPAREPEMWADDLQSASSSYVCLCMLSCLSS